MSSTRPAVGANRRDLAAARSRRVILRAATRLFADRGFDATPTASIADRARVPSALIFYHFGSKEALLDAIFDQPGLPDVLDQAIAEVTDMPPIDGLRAVARRVFGWFHGNEDYARLYLKEITSHRPIASRLRASRMRNIRRVAGYLDAAIRREHIPSADAWVLAQVFLSSLWLAVFFDRVAGEDMFALTLSEIITAGSRRNPRPTRR